MKNILITGASIAGPTLAWWLHKRGFAPVIVEKSAVPRPGGHAIDVRGAALTVLRSMGLADQAEAQRMRMKGVSQIDRDGNELWRSEDFTISGGSFSLEAIEILRDHLSRILVEDLHDGTEIIYGDSVTSYIEREADVLVMFQSGLERSFDLLVGADGLMSSTRQLVFGPDEGVLRPFNTVVAPFTAPNSMGLEDWQLTYKEAPGSCTVYTAPGNHTVRASFSFDARLEDVPSDRAGQIALIRKLCGHMGWHVPELLDAMESARDFYLGSFAQVKMPQWTRRRAALVGDAAYCPSPYTGQGTSLAIVGAYVLAYELSCSPDDHTAAFGRYEAKMRPFVEENHAIADLTRDERLSDPVYYTTVVEPALEKAKNAIVLEGLV